MNNTTGAKQMTTLNNCEDLLDVRDIIERFEELESDLQDAMDANEEGHNLETLAEYVTAASADCSAAHEHPQKVLADEYRELEKLLEQLEGGGDEEWRGTWYAGNLVKDEYFEDYARELLEDCGEIPRNLPHYIAIDWETTARNIRVDYTPVDFDGQTYWARF
jgi:hypothetical protein